MNLRGRNRVSPEFNMSSMTDIVFLLLIFFMLTSTMVTTNALDLVLPKAKGKTDSNKSISVSINKVSRWKKQVTNYLNKLEKQINNKTVAIFISPPLGNLPDLDKLVDNLEKQNYQRICTTRS